jgi:ribosomal protein S18 acetylase RimI-like enzyme
MEPYVDNVCSAADEEPNALGFLPQAAYAEAAEQERLLIAVLDRQGTKEYAGHLLFGFVFPNARISQTFVRPEFRRSGIGRKLVEALVGRAEKAHFLSIKASVANDLEANRFWERLGFQLVRRRPGKGKTGRTINIRIRELATPSLLDLMRVPSETQPPDLTFTDPLSGPSPVYAIDLNVLFDVTKKRPRAIEAGRVIRASFSNLVRLAVTEEFIRELERTSQPAPTDPILELAANLPILSAPPTAQLQNMVASLAPLVFPDRHRLGVLSDQDQSDLAHLATAIHNKVAGFITSEKAILRSRSKLRTDFGIDVVSVTEFVGMVEGSLEGEPPELQVASCGASISTREVQQDEDPDVRALFHTIQPPEELASEALKAELGILKRRVLVFCDSQAVALGCWEVPTTVRPQVQAALFADEDHGAVEQAIDFLLDSMSRESLHGTPVLISLTLPVGHVATARIALAHGFRARKDSSHRSNEFRKLCIGRPVHRFGWDTFADQIRKVSGLGFPEVMPDYVSNDQVVRVRNSMGATLTIPLNMLETLFSPVLFLLRGRPGAIVPIRRRYVDDLLGGCPQLSFLRPPEARLLHERVYFSSPRNADTLSEGTAILFYESGHDGGRASVIAAARAVRSERVSKNAITPRHTRRGVFEQKNLQQLTKTPTLAATTFDNVLPFTNPVPLHRLRQFGCSNFITARQISHEKLSLIIKEGISQ